MIQFEGLTKGFWVNNRFQVVIDRLTVKASAKQRLTDSVETALGLADGIVVLQSGELDPYDLGFARTVQTTLRQVFPWTLPMVIHVPSFHCIWSITLAGKRAHDPLPADLEDRVARLPAERLRAYSAGIHRALVTAPPWVERGLAVPGTVLSGEDERRLVTFRKDEGP